MTFDAFRESERRGWDERATGYGDATARATLQSIPTVLAHGAIKSGDRVLDAGCGPGYVAACAKVLGARPKGIDFAASMVSQARADVPDVEFVVGDVEALPYDDGSFDAVLSNIVLFHVTNPALAMSEAARVLTKGGRFVFSQWLGPDKSPCYKMIFDVLGAHADMSLADPAPNAYVLSDESLVGDMLRKAGFDDVRFDVVQNELQIEADSFFDFFMTFGVRVPLILDRQAPDVVAKIKADMDARADEFRTGGAYRVPMPSLVVSGRLV